MRVPWLNELDGRNLLVRMLVDTLGAPLPVREHPRPVEHLFSLVDACRCRPHGLAMLLEVLDRIDPGATHVADVHRVVDPMMVLEMWPDGERERLFALLGGVAVADVAELYGVAGGQWAPRLWPRATYQDAFALLETLSAGPDGVPLAVIFVELLANLVRPDLAQQLRGWSDRQAALIGVTDELNAARGRSPLADGRASLPTKPVPNVPAYLILQVQQEGVDGDAYRLSYWRQLDATRSWEPDRGADYQGDLAGVRQEVVRLAEKLEVDWAQYQPDVFVEFVLPDELLNLDVDQWAWDNDPRMPEPIGCHFRVVIRSLARMATQKWHRTWYQRWERLRSQLVNDGAIAPGSGYWSNARTEDASRAIVSAFEQEPALVALVPSAPPHARTIGADEVAAGFRTGVPVMVWHRENCLSADFVSAVTDLLHGDDPHDVLERVRLIRINGFAAGRDTAHVGNRLTLLWDDPGRRVTPDQPGAPTRMAIS